MTDILNDFEVYLRAEKNASPANIRPILATLETLFAGILRPQVMFQKLMLLDRSTLLSLSDIC